MRVRPFLASMYTETPSQNNYKWKCIYGLIKMYKNMNQNSHVEELKGDLFSSLFPFCKRPLISKHLRILNFIN